MGLWGMGWRGRNAILTTASSPAREMKGNEIFVHCREMATFVGNYTTPPLIRNYTHEIPVVHAAQCLRRIPRTHPPEPRKSVCHRRPRPPQARVGRRHSLAAGLGPRRRRRRAGLRRLAGQRQAHPAARGRTEQAAAGLCSQRQGTGPDTGVPLDPRTAH